MTHEELLAKIDDELKGRCDSTESCCFECSVFHALRAVVELHQPITDDDIHYECAGCGNNNPYKDCPTIQAIEKELA